MATKNPPPCRYRETEIRTANPLQLVVILYDGAIQGLQEAREQLRRGDIEARTRVLNRTMAIISELQASLNLEAGGQIARSLESLYAYMNRRIFEASFGQTAGPLDEVISLLTTLRSAWADLSQQGLAAAGASIVSGPEQLLPRAGKDDSCQARAVNISC